jgi:hypothetical protein
VHVYLFVSDQEGAVRANLERKERDAAAMFDALSTETRAAIQDEVLGQRRISNVYQAGQPIRLPPFIRSAA